MLEERHEWSVHTAQSSCDMRSVLMEWWLILFVVTHKRRGKERALLGCPSMPFDDVSMHPLQSSPVPVEDLDPCLRNKR